MASDPPGALLPAGHQLDGRYEVVEWIGEGGLATVYRVRHRQLGSDHALKVLKTGDPDLRGRLLLEGRAQAALRHPNLVAVTDVVEVAGAPGLILEYVAGPTLDQFLAVAQPSFQLVEELVEGILSGVAAAHDAGLVHRDLKPANVLLARVGGRLVPKVTDFGIAKLTQGATTGTRAGLALGTPAYMAPEQIRSAREVDRRADIFSLGAILYELVTGARAFPGAQIFEIFARIGRGEYVPPRAMVPNLPVRMERAIVGALRTEPSDRFESCAALLAAWRGEDSDLGTAPPRAKPTAPTLSPDLGPLAAWPPVSRSASPAHPVAPAKHRRSRGLLVVITLAGATSLALPALSPRAAGPSFQPAPSIEPVPAPALPLPSTSERAPASLPTVATPPGPPPAAARAPSQAARAVERGPAPVPPSAPPPPGTSEQTATVSWTGAREVWMEGPVQRAATGDVPAGTYSMRASFDGHDAAIELGTLILAPGDVRSIRCSAELLQCRVK